MKLGFQEGLIKVDGFEELVKKVVGWGFDAIEVWGEGLDKRVEDVADILKKYNLPASSVCPGGNGIRGSLLSEDKSDRELAADDIGMLIEMCARLDNAGLVLVPEFGVEKFMSLYPDHADFEKRAEIFAERLAPLVEKANGLDVTILLEPLNRYETFFMQTLAQGAKICDMIGSPSLKIMADLFHMGIEEDDVVGAIVDNSRHIAHVHLVDTNRKLPGLGNRDFKPVIDALKKIRFNGCLCMECGIPGDPAQEIPASVELIKKLL